MVDYLYNPTERELFIYDTSKIHTLNETGSFIFELFQKKYSIDEIVDHIVDMYEIDSDEVRVDVASFLKSMQELGIDFESANLESDPFDEMGSLFQPRTPIVHIIQNCNSPCNMCDCWKTKESIWHPADKLRPYFEKIKRLGAISIMVSGGEPLLHPELSQILTDLKELELEIMLNTNALLLHRNLWIADFSIENLVVSMDGIDPETYKTFRGLNGYQVVWNNMEKFHKHSPNTKIGIRTILNKINFDKMDILFDAIISRGWHSVGLSPADISSESFSRGDISTERSVSMKDLLLPTKKQIEEFLETFVPGNSYYQKIEEAASTGVSSWLPYDYIRCLSYYLSLHNGETKIFGNRPCFFPYNSMVLDYNGDLRNCFYSPAFGNLYQLEKSDWGFKSSMAELKRANRCQSCRGHVFCGAKLPVTSELANV